MTGTAHLIKYLGWVQAEHCTEPNNGACLRRLARFEVAVGFHNYLNTRGPPPEPLEIKLSAWDQDLVTFNSTRWGRSMVNALGPNEPELS